MLSPALQVYQRGCTLANHVDRAGTHIISAIINVAQKVCCGIDLFQSVCFTILETADLCKGQPQADTVAT